MTLVSPDQDACGPDCVEQHEGDCRDSGDTMQQAGSCGELHRFGGCDKAHDRCAGGVKGKAAPKSDEMLFLERSGLAFAKHANRVKNQCKRDCNDCKN